MHKQHQLASERRKRLLALVIGSGLLFAGLMMIGSVFVEALASLF